MVTNTLGGGRYSTVAAKATESRASVRPRCELAGSFTATMARPIPTNALSAAKASHLPFTLSGR